MTKAEKILNFMYDFRANKTAYINPNVYAQYFAEESCKILSEYILIQNENILGLVVIGTQYPLNALDLPIEEHTKVYDQIMSVKPSGEVLLDSDGVITYLDLNTNETKFFNI